MLQDTSNKLNSEHARSQQPLGEHQNSRLKPSLSAGQRVRGWFPRQCAFEVVANDHSYEDCKTKSIKKTRSKESNDVTQWMNHVAVFASWFFCGNTAEDMANILHHNTKTEIIKNIMTILPGGD